MKKTALVIGSVEIMLGILTWIVTNILNRLMPALGRVAYQMAAAGSYAPSNYHMNFFVPNLLALLLCILGTATILWFVFLKKED